MTENIMIIGLTEILLVTAGLYIGLLLNKHNILNWERACKPFTWVLLFTSKITNWGDNKNDKNKEKTRPPL
jgi:hypothetical protein